jgi:hypothetical protein
MAEQRERHRLEVLRDGGKVKLVAGAPERALSLMRSKP